MGQYDGHGENKPRQANATDITVEKQNADKLPKLLQGEDYTRWEIERSNKVPQTGSTSVADDEGDDGHDGNDGVTMMTATKPDIRCTQ